MRAAVWAAALLAVASTPAGCTDATPNRPFFEVDELRDAAILVHASELGAWVDTDQGGSKLNASTVTRRVTLAGGTSSEEGVRRLLGDDGVEVGSVRCSDGGKVDISGYEQLRGETIAVTISFGEDPGVVAVEVRSPMAVGGGIVSSSEGAVDPACPAGLSASIGLVGR